MDSLYSALQLTLSEQVMVWLIVVGGVSLLFTVLGLIEQLILRWGNRLQAWAESLCSHYVDD